MITIKLPVQNKIDISEYLNQWNSVVRFAYNRFHDDDTLKQSDVEKLVKSTMNNVDLIDASLIKSAVDKAKSIKSDKVIFGGKKNWYDYVKKLITKDEFKENRNLPLQVRGSTCDFRGNRKFKLDLINNNQIIFKPNRANHFEIKLPKLNKNYRKQLHLLEELCNDDKANFTCSVTNKHIWIMFEEKILKKPEINRKENRILSIDLNPNYVGLSICDYGVFERNAIVHKEIISIKSINDLDNKDKYADKEDKLAYRHYINNKRTHEVFEISKRIIQLCNDFNVETLALEKLNIKSKDKKQGKRFNKLCNNNWNRNALSNNLKKRCVINNIKYQEIACQYSSFIGQMQNPLDFDSVSASLEIGRRANIYIRQYIKKEYKHKVDVVFPKFKMSDLPNRWKKEVDTIRFVLKDWKEFYRYVKKSKLSYRFLFDESKFHQKVFRLKSGKSLIKCYVL